MDANGNANAAEEEEEDQQMPLNLALHDVNLLLPPASPPIVVDDDEDNEGELAFGPEEELLIVVPDELQEGDPPLPGLVADDAASLVGSEEDDDDDSYYDDYESESDFDELDHMQNDFGLIPEPGDNNWGLMPDPAGVDAAVPVAGGGDLILKNSMLDGDENHLNNPRSLVDISIAKMLGSTRNRLVDDVDRVPLSRFETILRSELPSTLFPKILAHLMLQQKIHPVYLHTVLRFWPEKVLSLQDLERNSTRLAELMDVETESQKFSSLCRINRILMTLVETFLHLVAYNANDKLQVLNLTKCPDTTYYHRIFRKTLEKNMHLIQDLSEYKRDCYISTVIDCQSLYDEKFWSKFISSKQTFIRITEIGLKSPLCHGKPEMTMQIVENLDKDRLLALQLFKERMFNRTNNQQAGDDLQDQLSRTHFSSSSNWLFQIPRFTNLVSLSLTYPPKVPSQERYGLQFTQVDKPRNRPSKSSVEMWAKILARMRALRDLSLQGNCLRNALADLLTAVPSGLVSLNVEGCMLSAKDLDFLAASKHAETLVAVSAGDLDLEIVFPSILNLVRAITKLESLSLCMEGYERYSNNHSLTSSQGKELIAVLQRKSHLSTLNIAGNSWDRMMLFHVLDRLSDMMQLRAYTLPVDGLGAEAVEYFVKKVKLPLAAGYDSQFGKGPQVVPKVYKELVTRLKQGLNRQKCPEGKWEMNALRDGLQILLEDYD